MIQRCSTCGIPLSETDAKIHKCEVNKAMPKPDMIKRFGDFDLRK